jgi:hypothetical protein
MLDLTPDAAAPSAPDAYDADVSPRVAALLDAMADALTPAFVHGVRHVVSRALGGWFRNCARSRSEAEYVVARLPSDDVAGRLADCAWSFDVATTPDGWATLAATLPSDVAAAIDATMRSVRGHDGAVERAQAAGVAPPPDPYAPTILQRRRSYWLRRLDGSGYTDELDEGDLRVQIENLYGSAWPYRDLKTFNIRPTRDFVLEPGVCRVPKHAVVDFAAHGVQYDVATDTLRQGFDLDPIAATYDADVDAWLRALFGAGYDRAAEWIASCRQDRMHRLSAALVIVGPKGIGKTLVFHALASMWGGAFVPLTHATQQFNARAATNPIWVDDEALALKSGKVDASGFCEIVQQRQRTFEPKGKERRDLFGAARIGVTSNALDDLNFGDVRAAASSDAIGDRLSLHVVPDDRGPAIVAALTRLNVDAATVDLERLKRHFAWVQSVVTLPDRRFVATHAEPGDAERAALSGVRAKYAGVFEVVRTYFDDGADITRAFHDDAGALWLSPSRLLQRCQSIGDHRTTLRDVHAALSPFRVGDSKTIRRSTGLRAGASEVVRMWRVDVGRLRQLQ